jgi:hypothetical protein
MAPATKFPDYSANPRNLSPMGTSLVNDKAGVSMHLRVVLLISSSLNIHASEAEGKFVGTWILQEVEKTKESKTEVGMANLPGLTDAVTPIGGFPRPRISTENIFYIEQQDAFASRFFC